MSERLSQSIRRTPLYSFFRPLAWLLFHTVYPVRVINRQILRAGRAPYLLIANHNSNLDSLLLAQLCPYELRGLGKRELIRGRFSKWLLVDKLGIIPVSRHEFDTQALRECLKALKEGSVLCVFPEGTRRLEHLMEKVEKGVTLLAMRQRANMLPVYIDGRLRPFRMNRAIVGEPMLAADYPQGPYTEAKADQLCEAIRHTFYALRDRLHQV